MTNANKLTFRAVIAAVLDLPVDSGQVRTLTNAVVGEVEQYLAEHHGEAVDDELYSAYDDGYTDGYDAGFEDGLSGAGYRGPEPKKVGYSYE